MLDKLSGTWKEKLEEKELHISKLEEQLNQYKSHLPTQVSTMSASNDLDIQYLVT